MGTLLMNEQTIERNGHTYYYDPDYDCYYRQYTRAELGHWDMYGWIYTIILLTVICAITTY
jgi:hypothetical protein